MAIKSAIKGKKMIFKRKIRKTLLYCVCIICILLMFYYGKKIIIWLKDNNHSTEMMNEIQKIGFINNNEEDKVDLETIKKINHETVGWIKVKNTNINYPIVQTSNNDYYLKHSFDKKINNAGWIFADFRNKFDNTDKNIIIYGHNRRDGSMFGTLKNVLEKKWYNNEENMIINMIIGEEEYQYIVFSVYKIEKEEYYLTTNFDNEKSFEDYIKRAKTRSIKDFNIEVSNKDNLLTLSTCADSNKLRVVMHSKKINSSKITK